MNKVLKVMCSGNRVVGGVAGGLWSGMFRSMALRKEGRNASTEEDHHGINERDSYTDNPENL